MTTLLGGIATSSGLSSSVQAFLSRYGGQSDEEAYAEAFGAHQHLASDIEGAFSIIFTEEVDFYTRFDDGAGNTETAPGYIRADISDVFPGPAYESAELYMESPEVQESGFRSAMILSSNHLRADIWARWDGTNGAFHFLGSDGLSRGFWTDAVVQIGDTDWGGELDVFPQDSTDAGGKIRLRAAGSNTEWFMDNQASALRFHHDGATYFELLAGGSFRLSQRNTTSGLPVMDLTQLDIDDSFVNFIGTRDGLVHVSELASHRVPKVTDVVNEGDEVYVKVLGIDDRGKVRLSMRAVDQQSGEELPVQAKPHGGRRPDRRGRQETG